MGSWLRRKRSAALRPRAIIADPSGISRRRRLEGNGRPAMVHHRSPAPASSDLRVPRRAPGGLRPIFPKRARPTRPPPRGGAARLPHVRRKENRNAGRTLRSGTMQMEPMELQHVVFETEEEGYIDAMWSDVRLHAHDIPDGWHCYTVRGGDGGWPPCSIERSVWVNHAGDIITPVDLDPLLEKTTGCSSSRTGGSPTSRSGTRNERRPDRVTDRNRCRPQSRGRRLRRPEDDYRPLYSTSREQFPDPTRRRRATETTARRRETGRGNGAACIGLIDQNKPPRPCDYFAGLFHFLAPSVQTVPRSIDGRLTQTGPAILSMRLIQGANHERSNPPRHSTIMPCEITPNQ